jgi:hypothetical protein
MIRDLPELHTPNASNWKFFLEGIPDQQVKVSAGSTAGMTDLNFSSLCPFVSLCLSGLNQSLLLRFQNCFGAGYNMQFLVDLFHVRSDRFVTDKRFFSDCAEVVAFGDE